MSNDGVDRTKRRLIMVTSGLGAVGAAFAATPFVLSMTPSARAKAAGAPVEVDISQMEPGQLLTVEWRGKPVWILKRTPEMLEAVQKSAELVADPQSRSSDQPKYASDVYRAINEKIFVVVGICTHLGCSPAKRLSAGSSEGMSDDWLGGFFCPCHGSKFDLSGRVYKNVPAPTNLPVPPHKYLSESRILIGEDQA
jgi:ubiquinol-cytochrome c reductase iron-sulfur subunit